MEPSRKNTFTEKPAFWLTLIFLLGLFIRLYKLDFQSFWMDEYLNILVAKQSPDYFRDSLGSFIPPLYIFVLGGWLKFVPLSEITARLPGALMGSLAIPLFYILGKEMLDKKTSLWAAFFLAISAIHIDYSQEAKYYSLMFLFVLLTSLEYWRAVHIQKQKHFFLYAIYFILLLYTHYYCGVFFFIHWAHLWLHHRTDKKLLKKMALAHGTVLLALAPAVSYIAFHFQEAIQTAAWIQQPAWSAPLRSLIAMVAGQQWRFHWPLYTTKELIAVLLSGFIAFSAFIFWLKRKEAQAHQSAFSLIILWITVPLLFFYLFSITFFSIYQTRYVLPVMFGVYLLFAWIVASEFSSKKRSFLFIASLIILSGYICIDAWALKFYFNYPVRAPFRQTAQWISQKMADDETISFIGYGTEGRLLNYYLKKYGINKKAAHFDKTIPWPADFDWIVDGSYNFKADPALFVKEPPRSLAAPDVYRKIKAAAP